MFSTLLKKITGSGASAHPHGDDAYDAMDSTLPLLYLDEKKLPEHWSRIENHPPRDQGFPVVSMKALLAPHRQMLLDIKHNLRLDEDKYKSLFDPVLLRFMDFVYNLPSSQYNHHAGPGGALHHALQVARQCSQVSCKYTLYKMRGGPTMSLERVKEGEQYARLAVTIAGLLHDVGKPLTDLRVSLERPGKSDDESKVVYWPAHQIGLRSWLIQMKATEYFITFRPGRGTDHKKIGRGALERFITPEIRQEFDNVDQSFLPRICDALDCVNADDDHFVRIVMEADNRSAAQDAAASEQRRTDRRTGLPVVHATLNSIAELVNRDRSLINDRGAILWNTDEGLFIDIEKAYPLIKKYRVNELGQSFPVSKEVLIEDLVNAEYCQPWDANENSTGPYWPVTPSVLVQGRDPNSFHLWLLKLVDKSHIPTDLPHVTSATIVPASVVYKQWKKKDAEVQSKLTGSETVSLGEEYEANFEEALAKGDQSVAQIPSGNGSDESIEVDTTSGEIVSTEHLPSAPNPKDVPSEQTGNDQEDQVAETVSTDHSVETGSRPEPSRSEESSTQNADASSGNMMDALQGIGDDLPMPFDMGPGDADAPTKDSSPKPSTTEKKTDKTSESDSTSNKPVVDASSLNLAPGNSSGGSKKGAGKKGSGKKGQEANSQPKPSKTESQGQQAPKPESQPEASKPEAVLDKDLAPKGNTERRDSQNAVKPPASQSAKAKSGSDVDLSPASGKVQPKPEPKHATSSEASAPEDTDTKGVKDVASPDPHKKGAKEPEERNKQRSAIKSAVKGPRTYAEVKAQEQAQSAGRQTPTSREDAWKIVKATLQPYGNAGAAVMLRLSEVIDGNALVGQTWFFHNKKYLSMAYPDCFKGLSEPPVELKKVFENSNVLICDSKYPHKSVWEIDGVLGIMFNESISLVVSDLIKLAEFDRDPFAEPPDPARKYHGRKKTASQKKKMDIDLSPSSSSSSGEKAHEKDVKPSPKNSGKPENGQRTGATLEHPDGYDPTNIDSIVKYMWLHITTSSW